MYFLTAIWTHMHTHDRRAQRHFLSRRPPLRHYAWPSNIGFLVYHITPSEHRGKSLPSTVYDKVSIPFPYFGVLFLPYLMKTKRTSLKGVGSLGRPSTVVAGLRPFWLGFGAIAAPAGLLLGTQPAPTIDYKHEAFIWPWEKHTKHLLPSHKCVSNIFPFAVGTFKDPQFFAAASLMINLSPQSKYTMRIDYYRISDRHPLFPQPFA